jgi:hypothetical protein
VKHIEMQPDKMGNHVNVNGVSVFELTVGRAPRDGFRLPPLKGRHPWRRSELGFLVYFGVPDLEVAIADVNRLGGAAEIPTDEPGFGRFCICRDPQGLRFGLHQR